jgi:hypothetical protein
MIENPLNARNLQMLKTVQMLKTIQMFKSDKNKNLQILKKHVKYSKPFKCAKPSNVQTRQVLKTLQMLKISFKSLSKHSKTSKNLTNLRQNLSMMICFLILSKKLSLNNEIFKSITLKPAF